MVGGCIVTLLAYRYALDPTPSQGRALLDRWYPSSKTCSECGAVRAKLTLSERMYHCDACGLVLDRDVNAAVNLARLAGSASDRNGRGADRQTPPGCRWLRNVNPAPRQRVRPGASRRKARVRHERYSALNRNGGNDWRKPQRMPTSRTDAGVRLVIMLGGGPVTGELIERFAAEAEAGYDVEVCAGAWAVGESLQSVDGGWPSVGRRWDTVGS